MPGALFAVMYCSLRTTLLRFSVSIIPDSISCPRNRRADESLPALVVGVNREIRLMALFGDTWEPRRLVYA